MNFRPRQFAKLPVASSDVALLELEEASSLLAKNLSVTEEQTGLACAKKATFPKQQSSVLLDERGIAEQSIKSPPLSPPIPLPSSPLICSFLLPVPMVADASIPPKNDETNIH